MSVTRWPLRQKAFFRGPQRLHVRATELRWLLRCGQWDVRANLLIPLRGKTVLASTAQQYAVCTPPGNQQASVSLCPSVTARSLNSTVWNNTAAASSQHEHKHSWQWISFKLGWMMHCVFVWISVRWGKSRQIHWQCQYHHEMYMTKRNNRFWWETRKRKGG